MVIQCPHCQARFKLPQEKIKQGGTKVRCTKCKIVFMVTPPQGDSPGETEPSKDLPLPVVEESSFEGPEGLEEGFDAAEFYSDGNEGDEFLLAQTEAEEDKDEFFTADGADFDSQDQLTWAEDGEDPFAVAEKEEEAELPSAEELFPAPLEQASSEEPAAPDETEEIVLGLALEEPEDEGGAAGSLDEQPFLDQALPRSPLPAPRPPAERRKKSRGGKLWLMVLILLLVGGGYAYQARQQWTAYWQELLIEWQLIPVPPSKAEGLKPVRLAGYFVANRREGRLFVIQGQVLNEGPEAKAAIVVQGTVYDRGGRQLFQQSAFCGNPMDKEQLQAWPMLRISERMQNQFGEMLANLNLEPKKAIPFTLVFKGLEEDVAEFEVAVTGSEPVIK